LQPSIDSAKVAVIGISIGASLALYSKLFPAVKTVVGISGGRGKF